MREVYAEESVLGEISRLVLHPPCKFYYLEKSLDGGPARRIPRIHSARLNLRYQSLGNIRHFIWNLRYQRLRNIRKFRLEPHVSRDCEHLKILFETSGIKCWGTEENMFWNLWYQGLMNIRKHYFELGNYCLNHKIIIEFIIS